jgi:oligopeptide transport system permease protein
LAGAAVSGSRSAAASAPSPSLFVKLRDDAVVGDVRRGGDAPQILRRPSISYWQDARMRLRRNRVAMAALGYIVLLALAAAIVPEVIHYAYDEQEIWNKHRTPTFGEVAMVIDSAGIPYEPVLSGVPPAGAVADTETVGTAEAGAVVTDPPATPEGLEAVGQPLTVGVVIKWRPVPGADGYRIYRSIAKDTLGVPLDDVTPDLVSYRDTSSLSLGSAYYYFVTAFNAFGESQATPPLPASPLLALTLADALKLDPTAKVGGTVMTNPHFLGTDYLGRDMLARVMMGARISLFIGIGAPLLYVFFGIVYGSVSGFFGGLVDDAMMRVTDIFVTVPELLVVILLQVVLGNGVTTLIIAMVAVTWSRSAIQIRGEILRVRQMEFVHAAKVLGTGIPKTIFRHLLPNVMGSVLVIVTLAVPQAIFTEAFLSFIGLGIAPPMASWGTVTKEGARVFLTYPHELVIPSVLICATMLAFNLFGDGLRDALDPKLRGAR